MQWLLDLWQAGNYQSNLMQLVQLSPIALLLLDLLTGVLSALRNGTFTWKSFADILGKDVLKYLGGLGVTTVSGAMLNWQFGVSLLVNFCVLGLGLNASVLASVLENLKELFPASVQPVIAELEKDLAADAQRVTSVVRPQSQQAVSLAPQYVAPQPHLSWLSAPSQTQIQPPMQ